MIHFNPWEWAGHSELAQAFFSEVAGALGLVSESERYRAVAKQWRRYHDALSLAASGPIKWRAVGLALAVCGLASVGADYADLANETLLRFVTGFVIVVLGVNAAFPGQVAEAYERLADQSRRTLSQEQDALSKSLRGLAGPPIVIVVDDIDRLRPDDLVRMLQIIKANGSLPRLVLLGIDRLNAAEGIRSSLGVNGAAYLDKIIQVGLTVPEPLQADLNLLLSDRLSVVLRDLNIDAQEYQVQFQEVTLRAVPLLTTPRSIVRVVSAFHFAMRQQLVDGVPNVNPADVFAMEVIRQREPKVFARLADAQEALIGMFKPIAVLRA